jgi:hypothetical protein
MKQYTNQHIDQWVIGTGTEHGQTYIVHTCNPVFIAKLIPINNDTFSHRYYIGVVEWVDIAPDPQTQADLFQIAVRFASSHADAQKKPTRHLTLVHTDNLIHLCPRTDDHPNRR